MTHVVTRYWIVIFFPHSKFSVIIYLPICKLVTTCVSSGMGLSRGGNYSKVKHAKIKQLRGLTFIFRIFFKVPVNMVYYRIQKFELTVL